MAVNKVILLGNVTQDPEVKSFDNGGKVANFSIATSERGYKTKDGRDIPERTDFHRCVVNGKLVDIVEKYVHKGDKLYVEGTLRNRSWGEGDAKRTVTEVHISTVELLPKSNGEPTKAVADDEDLPF